MKSQHDKIWFMKSHFEKNYTHFEVQSSKSYFSKETLFCPTGRLCSFTMSMNCNTDAQGDFQLFQTYQNIAYILSWPNSEYYPLCNFTKIHIDLIMQGPGNEDY